MSNVTLSDLKTMKEQDIFEVFSGLRLRKKKSQWHLN